MNIFISANNTDAGKTYTTLALIESISKLGLKVGVMKPIETGVDKYPKDAALLLEKVKKFNPSFKDLTVFDITPIQHNLAASPFVSGIVNLEKIQNSYKEIKKLCDVLLIEGAGGILTPVKEDFYMIDFVDFFDAKLFMVFSSKLGMINDFLLNYYFLKSKKIKYDWAVNIFDDSYFKISHPFIKRFNPLFIQYDLDKITKKLIGE